MIRENFTKALLDNLKPPHKGRSYLFDAKVNGLALYITNTGSRTFYVRKRIRGRDQKLIVGAYPDVSIENARKQALNFLGQIALGKDPQEEARKERQDNLTLGKQVADYMERHSKLHKKSWKFDEHYYKSLLSHWYNRKLSDIRREEILLLREKLFRERGLYQANRVLERLSHLYTKAIEWGWEGNNPVKGIKKYKEKSRDRFILPGELKFFHEALNEDNCQHAKDFFKLLLLTGVRKGNLLTMRFEHIDFEWKTWRIPDTKNNEPLTLPLLDKAIEILERRRRFTNSEWVFPSPSDNTKHFTDPRYGWMRIIQRATIYLWQSESRTASIVYFVLQKINMYEYPADAVNEIKRIANEQGVYLPAGLLNLRIHDLRRTIGSYQAISGSSLHIIGASLGHKSPQSTKIYARLILEPVKESLQTATDLIFKEAIELKSDCL